MGFIGDRQPCFRSPFPQSRFQQLRLPASRLVGQQHPIRGGHHLLGAGPGRQGQVQPCCGAVPLLKDRCAVAKHHDALQMALLQHAAERQQGTKGFPCTGARKDQHVLSAARVVLQATAQQLDQLLLPLPRSDRRPIRGRLDVKTEGLDDVRAKDESF